MAYAPSIYDPTQPIGSVTADNAAPEFRTIKANAVFAPGRIAALYQNYNSVAVSTLIDFVVPAGALKTNKKLRLTAKGLLENSTGADHYVSISAYYNVSTLVAGAFIATTAANKRALSISIELGNRFATNSQFAATEISMYASGALASLNSISPTYPMGSTASGIAEDSTVAQHLIVYLQLDTASALFGITMDSVVIEYI